jgi:hypothetical protein
MFCWDTLVVVRGGMSLPERSLDLYFLGFHVKTGLGAAGRATVGPLFHAITRKETYPRLTQRTKGAEEISLDGVQLVGW